jgi:REP element-mobilizing transposase RayT
MPVRKTTFVRDGYYHIYNRGANRQNIFYESENYLFLLKRLKKYALKFHIMVIAYCLMPNHYHFLLRQDGENSISLMIQHLFNSYSKAFNKKYHKTGTLFEDRFKSIHIDDESYLLHLCRYIHRNPVDAETPLCKLPDDWPFSNYLDWIGKRNGELICAEFIDSVFVCGREYEKFVHDYRNDLYSKKFRKYMFDTDVGLSKKVSPTKSFYENNISKPTLCRLRF